MRNTLLIAILACVSLSAVKATATEVWFEAKIEPTEKTKDWNIIVTDERHLWRTIIPYDQPFEVKLPPHIVNNGAYITYSHKSDGKLRDYPGEKFSPKPNAHYRIEAKCSAHMEYWGKKYNGEGCTISVEEIK